MVTSSAAGEAGNVFADGIVEAQLALLLKHENCGRRKLFGNRSDGVAHLRRGRDWPIRIRRETRETVGVGVDQLAVLDDCDRCGGNAGSFEDLLGDVVDTAAQVGRNGIYGLGRGSMSGEGQQKNGENC